MRRSGKSGVRPTEVRSTGSSKKSRVRRAARNRAPLTDPDGPQNSIDKKGRTAEAKANPFCACISVRLSMGQPRVAQQLWIRQKPREGYEFTRTNA